MNPKYRLAIVIFLFSLFSIVSYTYGQENWNNEQKQLIEAMNSLSETTAPNGKGADAYGNFLSDDFSRWTIGSKVTNNKEKWVEGVREWFEDGWRVSDRQQQILEILIFNDFAHTRRIVTETYLGPDGDTSVSKAALAELWTKKDGQWVLHIVNVQTLPND